MLSSETSRCATFGFMHRSKRKQQLHGYSITSSARAKASAARRGRAPSPRSGSRGRTWSAARPEDRRRFAPRKILSIKSPRRERPPSDGGREFLFFVADLPDADYLARCVLD